MKNVLKPLVSKCCNTIAINSSSISKRWNYSKEIFWSGMTTLMISNEEMDDILNITKSLKEFGLLIKGVSGTIEKKTNFLTCL